MTHLSNHHLNLTLPVYVRNGVEYCIVLQSDSDKYFAWISRMGEQILVEQEWYQNNHILVFFSNHKIILLGLHMIMKT